MSVRRPQRGSGRGGRGGAGFGCGASARIQLGTQPLGSKPSNGRTRVQKPPAMACVSTTTTCVPCASVPVSTGGRSGSASASQTATLSIASGATIHASDPTDQRAASDANAVAGVERGGGVGLDNIMSTPEKQSVTQSKPLSSLFFSFSGWSPFVREGGAGAGFGTFCLSLAAKRGAVAFAASSVGNATWRLAGSGAASAAGPKRNADSTPPTNTPSTSAADLRGTG